MARCSCYAGALVSGNGFELLGLRPRLGRLLTPADDVPGGGPTGWPAVVSEGYWRERYGGDPRHSRHDGEDPRRGRHHRRRRARGVPWRVSRRPSRSSISRSSSCPRWSATPAINLDAPRGRLHLRDDRTAEARRLHRRSDRRARGATCRPLIKDFGPNNPRWQQAFASSKLTLESARTGLPTFFGRQYSKPLYLMQGLVGIVLLLCCVNVSGLMLSKLHERQHEFAVRTAIGAGRMRLMRQYLTESFVIALAGAALGAAAAWYGSRLLLPFFRDPNQLLGMDIQPDRTVFFVTAGLAVGHHAVLRPGAGVARGTHESWLAAEGARGRAAAARGTRLRRHPGRPVARARGAGDAAVAESEQAARRADRIRLRARHHPDAAVQHAAAEGLAKLDLYQRMVDRIAQAPGIASAAVTWYTPMTGFQSTRANSKAADPKAAASAEDLTLVLQPRRARLLPHDEDVDSLGP